MDMSLAVIARLLDRAAADKVAQIAEYQWHDDASADPFAGHYGLG